MKTILWKMYDAAATDGAGGAPDATAVVLKAIDGMKAGMVKKEDVTAIAGAEIIKANEPIIKSISEVRDQLNKLDERAGAFMINTGAKQEKKSFTQVFADAVEKNIKDISNVRKGNSFKMELDLKTVGTMIIADNLTGDSVINYGRNAILPSTRVNFRDLIPTSRSSTLVQAYYRESAGEGAITTQTEGSAKGQIDFDLTEVKTVTKYVSGFVRFSKQIAKALPFLQGTLPRMLLREFFSGATGENASFFSTVSQAATGSTTTSETDDVKAIIDYIANQRTAKFNASYGLVNHAQLARLNKLTYVNGYYTGSGGVVTNMDGSMVISGMPLVPVDWVTDDKILIFDMDYLERVEAESLVIEFFEQDSDNVQKNLITARIECLEEVNPMMPTSMIYADLGNVT